MGRLMGKYVAFFLPSLVGGGAEKTLVELASGLLKRGVQVDFVLMKTEGDFLSSVPSAARIINLKSRNAYVSFVPLLEYLRQNSPDILISPFELTSLISLLVKRISKIDTRIVVILSTTISRTRRPFYKKVLGRFLLSRIYPWAHRIVAVSQGVARDFSEYTKIPADRVKVILNPVITKQLAKNAQEPLEHPFFMPSSPAVILGVGRLEEEKNFELLINAFYKVRQTMPSRLLILGEGKYRDKLNKMVQSLGIGADVDLPGFVSNPYSYMSRASVFVLSSNWEGLPTVLIEALACGCPVVSTNCPGGASEILGGGKYGHLVPMDDANSLAKAIVAVVQGDHRRPPADWLDQFKVDLAAQEYVQFLELG